MFLQVTYLISPKFMKNSFFLIGSLKYSTYNLNLAFQLQIFISYLNFLIENNKSFSVLNKNLKLKIIISSRNLKLRVVNINFRGRQDKVFYSK